MKNIFIFNEKAIASAYGVGTYVKQFVECFQRKPDISLHIINLYTDAEEFCVIEKEKYKEINIPSIRHISKDEYNKNILYLIYSIGSGTNSSNATFILNFYYPIEFIDLIRELYPNCQIVTVIHFQNWCFSIDGDLSYFKKLIYAENQDDLSKKEKEIINSFQMEQKQYENSDLIICLSKFTYDLLQTEYHIPEQKLSLIYNGLEDYKNLLSIEEKKIFKQQHYIHRNDKIILFVGRLNPIKGLSYLIEAFKILLNTHTEYRLIIIGTGNYEKYLQESLSCCGKVMFTGHLEKETLYKFYQIADIGIQLSLHEQCSYVMIEMMMFNIPLLISNTTGLNEMIDDDRYKVNATFDQQGIGAFSAQECADKIYDILNNRKINRFENRHRYIERHSLNNMYQSLSKLELFSDL